MRHSKRPAEFCCPFYTGDEDGRGKDGKIRHRVYCSGGQRVCFHSQAEMLDWIGRMCGNVPGWEGCSIARMLFEREK